MAKTSNRSSPGSNLPRALDSSALVQRMEALDLAGSRITIYTVHASVRQGLPGSLIRSSKIMDGCEVLHSPPLHDCRRTRIRVPLPPPNTASQGLHCDSGLWTLWCVVSGFPMSSPDFAGSSTAGTQAKVCPRLCSLAVVIGPSTGPAWNLARGFHQTRRDFAGNGSWATD